MSKMNQSLITILRPEAGDSVPPRNDLKTWEHILIAARNEGLCGLVLESLERNGYAAPQAVVEKLLAQAEHIGEVNRFALRRLQRIANAFASRRIDLMLLKGAALVLSLYRNPGLRPMCDLDLLIRSGDAERADRLLHSLGYRRGQTLLREDFYPRYHYEAEYLAQGPQPLRLDVHVRPLRPLRYYRAFAGEAVWSERRKVSLGDTTIDMPGDVDMLIHLTCHAAFHGATSPLWLVDISRFVTTHLRRLDWDRFVGRLEARNLLHAARFALERTEQAFGPCLLDATRKALQSAPAGWRDRLALWQAPRDRASPWMHTLVDLLCTEGRGFRLGYLHAVLLPDRAHMAEGYHRDHRGWVFFAHVKRMLNGLWRTASSVVRGNTPAAGP